jgi:hypothetical protein
MKLRIPVVLIVSAAALAGCTARLTVSDSQLERFPLAAKLPGKPARSGQRHWARPFEAIRSHGAYVSVVRREGQYELWRGSLMFGATNSHGRLGKPYHKAAPEEKVAAVSRGPNMQALGKLDPRFDASLVDDVFSPDNPDELAWDRGFTRTSMQWFPELGYVFYCCVTRGYAPGANPLYPAFFTSPTGAPGTWTYRGKMKGEPLAEAAKRVIWSDGGSLHRLSGGRWRAYLNGFGQVGTAVESDALDGEWTFVRDAKGAIRELLPDFPKGPHRGGCWIHVLQVGAAEWHLWLTDTWPAQSIWHYSSDDGLEWRPYGQQPELTRRAVGGRAIKCLRTYFDSERNEIVGMLSVRGSIDDGPEGWVLHLSHMDTGLQP